ncbi:MAG: FecR family protein [Candidatus Aenigmarchaeota archaeon]
MISKKVLIPVIILIIIGGVAGYFYFKIAGPPAIAAQLVVDTGVVEMKAGDTWETVATGQVLTQADTIRTAPDARASIIFFGSSIIRLDGGTEVTIKDLILDRANTKVTIEQASGRTWSKVLKLSGIEEYSVQTPTTVASVRGTAFGFYLGDDGMIYIKLLEGSLNAYTYSMETGQLIKIDEADITAGQMITVDLDLGISIGDLAGDDWVTENTVKDDAFLEQQLEDILNRMSDVIAMGKAQYGVTDQEIEDSVRCWLKGECEIPPEMPQWVIDIAIRN